MSGAGKVAAGGVAILALAFGFVGGRAVTSVAAQGQAPESAVQQAPHLPQVQASQASYSAIVDRVGPAVVTVRVEKKVSAAPAGLPDSVREFFGRDLPRGFDLPREHRQGGLGSGVIIRADGYVITNTHVVTDAQRIRVDLADGRSFDAHVVGTDPASDLAVLRIDARGLPTVTLGDSDTVKVGDVVLAFGNPLGVGQTVTMGIVSAKERATGAADGGYEDFIQTDAPINQGNSGGALVNLRGELIGINAQILSPSGGNIGLGFAIPSTMVRTVTDQLMRDGVVHRSMLGVVVQPLTADLAAGLGVKEARGALVSSVEPGSPAARAGVQQGDVITAFDGRPVTDANGLRNHVAASRPGSTVSLKVLRAGREQVISARLVEREQRAESTSSANRSQRDAAPLGVAAEPLTPESAGRLGLPRTATGLVITDVDPDGAAADVGIRPGDVITRANDKDVRTVSELRDALAARADRPSLVLLTRDGQSLFVAIPPRA